MSDRDNAEYEHPLASLKVGDEVIIRDLNEHRLGGRQTGVVVKVGRKLLHVRGNYDTRTYEIETGCRNDRYRHSWIVTPKQQAELDRRNDLLRRLSECHLEIRMGYDDRFTTEQIEAILRVIEDHHSGS